VILDSGITPYNRLHRQSSPGENDRTPLLLVPGLLCSPRLFAPQVAALADVADMVVPDWRAAPPGIFDSMEKNRPQGCCEHKASAGCSSTGPKDARLR
jgi:hypothetical protein